MTHGIKVQNYPFLFMNGVQQKTTKDGGIIYEVRLDLFK